MKSLVDGFGEECIAVVQFGEYEYEYYQCRKDEDKEGEKIVHYAICRDGHIGNRAVVSRTGFNT